MRRGWTEDELTIAIPKQVVQGVIDHAVEEAKVFSAKIMEVVIEVSESVFQLMNVREGVVPGEDMIANGHVEGVGKAECSVLLFHEEQIAWILVLCMNMILMCWGGEVNNFRHNKSLGQAAEIIVVRGADGRCGPSKKESRSIQTLDIECPHFF